MVLAYLVGRPLTTPEIYTAFGMKRSAYFKARREGRLVTANNLLRAARHFGLDGVDLLMRYGLIESSDDGL